MCVGRGKREAAEREPGWKEGEGWGWRPLGKLPLNSRPQGGDVCGRAKEDTCVGEPKKIRGWDGRDEEEEEEKSMSR